MSLQAVLCGLSSDQQQTQHTSCFMHMIHATAFDRTQWLVKDICKNEMACLLDRHQQMWFGLRPRCWAAGRMGMFVDSAYATQLAAVNHECLIAGRVRSYGRQQNFAQTEPTCPND